MMVQVVQNNQKNIDSFVNPVKIIRKFVDVKYGLLKHFSDNFFRYKPSLKF